MDFQRSLDVLKTKFQETIMFYSDPEKMGLVISATIKIILILIGAKIAIKFSNIIIDKFFESRKKFKLTLEDNRVHTLTGILKSIIRYSIYFIAFMPILETMNIDVKALITAAGIGGLAIGFGAQNLVRDIITGFFILFEDQFTVGDYVDVGGMSGIVEEMALRVTKIRDFSGDLHIVPNGAIDKVTNRCRGNMRALVKMSIAYEENIERALEVLRQASETLAKESEDIVEGPIVLGVTDFGASDIVITIIAKVKPMSQWAVERLMRQRFKETFDKEGIEIPYPKRVIYNGLSDDE